MKEKTQSSLLSSVANYLKQHRRCFGVYKSLKFFSQRNTLPFAVYDVMTPGVISGFDLVLTCVSVCSAGDWLSVIWSTCGTGRVPRLHESWLQSNYEPLLHRQFKAGKSLRYPVSPFCMKGMKTASFCLWVCSRGGDKADSMTAGWDRADNQRDLMGWCVNSTTLLEPFHAF